MLKTDDLDFEEFFDDVAVCGLLTEEDILSSVVHSENPEEDELGGGLGGGRESKWST